MIILEDFMLAFTILEYLKFELFKNWESLNNVTSLLTFPIYLNETYLGKGLGLVLTLATRFGGKEKERETKK